MVLSKTDFTCSEVGSNPVTLTVTDNNGNIAICGANVEVEDNVVPTVSCNNVTIQLDILGNGSTSTGAVHNTSADACGIASTILSKTDFTCTDVGSNPVTLTVTDNNGNTATCDANVEVEDNVVPTVSCQDVTVQLDASGNGATSAVAVNINSADACGIFTMILSTTGFTCGEVGSNPVTLTVTDNNGNTATCGANVEVEDNVPPTATCQDVTVQLDASGDGTTSAGAVNNGSADACGIFSMVLSTTDFTCTEVGSNPVTLTVTDNNGNTATCGANVEVEDNIPPTVSCQDVTVQLDALGVGSTTAGAVHNTSADACGISSTVLSTTDFTCGEVGSNPVTLTVTDNNGNTATCGANVEVEDNVVPTVSCQDVTVQLGASGNGSTTAVAINNGSADACGISTMVLSKTDFTCDDVGSNPVTLTVTDNNGNTATCGANVEVEDNVAPTATCQDVTVQLDASGNGSTTAGAIDNNSADACGIASMVLSTTDFTCSEVGSNAVTLTVTDNNGNTATCGANVEVEDNVAPTATCQDVTVQLDASGNGSTTAGAIDNNSADACGIASMVLSTTDFTCGEVGSNPVTLTVTDNNGNTATCGANVEVEDNTPPTAFCKNITLELDGNGSSSIVTSDIDGGSDDNCTFSLSAGKTSFDCSNVGNNTVTLTVTDASNNTAVCNATVSVEDNTAPTPICKNTTIQLNGYGVSTIVASDIDGGSGDNCTFNLSASKTSFDCTNIGTNTVTLTVTDASNNTAICGAIVSVEDNITPIVFCNPIEVVLYVSGEYVLNENDVENISSWSHDNCSSYKDLEITVFPNSFQCIHVGVPVTVEVTVVDQSGNESNCETTVTVYDKTPPIAKCEDIEVKLDAQGKAFVFPGQIDAGDINVPPAWARTYNGLEDGSYDACGVDYISLDKQEFDCSDIGKTKVALTVTDPSGNFSVCHAFVTVTDDLFPAIDPVTDVEIMVAPGICSTAVDYPVITVNDNCGSALVQTAGLGPNGVFPLGVTSETWIATNNGVDTAEVSFTVTVTTTNAPPTLDPVGDVEFDEDTPPLNIALAGISDGGDCVAQDVTVSAVSTNPALITGLTVNYTSGNTNASLDVTVAPDMNGQSEITVTVEDSEGASTVEILELTVHPVNDPPFLINQIPDQIINAPYVLKLPISQVQGVIFGDIDDETLSFAVALEGGAPLPAWATITGDTLVCSPLLADTGCINVVVRATDPSGASASDIFVVCVDNYLVGIGHLGEGVFEVKMYPNPTEGLVNLDINTQQGFDTEISVMNIVGEEIFRRLYKAAEQTRFDLSGHVSGMYMVNIKIEGRRVVKKLILDRK